MILKLCRQRLSIEEKVYWGNMELRVFDIKIGITKLGPGVRFGIWTQGCPRRCSGCMSPNSQALDQGYLVDVDTLSKQIADSGLTELTISGGEPFLQAEELIALIDKVREAVDLGVIIYTGYTIEELNSSENAYHKQLLNKSDLIIDGAYVESLNDGKNLRGSSNQRAIPLTDRYRDFSKEFGTKPAEVEFFFQEERISMIGVPSRETLERFKQISF